MVMPLFHVVTSAVLKYLVVRPIHTVHPLHQLLFVVEPVFRNLNQLKIFVEPTVESLNRFAFICFDILYNGSIVVERPLRVREV